MKRGMMFVAIGSLVLLFGFLLKAISFTSVLDRTPPYMGPPVDPSILHTMRMWLFPYVLDTMSLAILGVSVGLILLGIAISFRRKTMTSMIVPPRDTLNPYQ
ncbi:MAG TPA: hypothetical protein VFX64_00370 [Candidatus Nitrosotalea sp.]|nr:hypothetical protein [Candidatus Nitrosotalea sp.]